jgi:hypothetical protein
MLSCFYDTRRNVNATRCDIERSTTMNDQMHNGMAEATRLR